MPSLEKSERRSTLWNDWGWVALVLVVVVMIAVGAIGFLRTETEPEENAKPICVENASAELLLTSSDLQVDVSPSAVPTWDPFGWLVEPIIGLAPGTARTVPTVCDSSDVLLEPTREHGDPASLSEWYYGVSDVTFQEATSTCTFVSAGTVRSEPCLFMGVQDDVAFFNTLKIDVYAGSPPGKWTDASFENIGYYKIGDYAPLYRE